MLRNWNRNFPTASDVLRTGVLERLVICDKGVPFSTGLLCIVRRKLRLLGSEKRRVRAQRAPVGIGSIGGFNARAHAQWVDFSRKIFHFLPCC